MLSDSKPFHLPPALLQRGVQACFALIYAALSLWALMSVFVGSNFTDDNFNIPVVQQRPLVNTAAQLLVALTPDVLEQAATEKLLAFRDGYSGQYILRLRYEDTRHPANPFLAHVSEQEIFVTAMKMLVVYVTECLFIWMLYRLALALFPESRAYALLAPVLALLVVGAFAPEYAYTYDFAELFFSCALLYAMLKQRFYLYLLLLALGTLNKETTLFGIFFFAVWFVTRIPQRRYVEMLVWQVLIYVFVKQMVVNYYGHNLQDMFATHWRWGLLALYNYDYYHVILLVVTLVLLTFRWQEKPLFLRYALWMFVPNVLAYIITCNRYEYRDLYWCMPPMFLLASHTLVELAHVAHLPIFKPKTTRMKE